MNSEATLAIILLLILAVIVAIVAIYIYYDNSCTTACHGHIHKTKLDGTCYCGYLYSNGTIRWWKP